MLLFSHMLPLAAAIDPPAYYAPGPLNIENPLLWPNPADMPAGAAAVLPEERATQAAVHYAFSTGCEVQHDWQSLGVFYSARKAAPYSNITRLVSCYHASNAKEDGHDWPAPNGMKFNDDTIIATQVTGGEDAANTKGSAAGVDEKLKRSLYSLPERRAVGQFHLSPLFSPNRVTGDNYAPYCKSASLAHWFAKAPPAEPIVVNLDPDVILLRPLDAIDPEALRGRPIAQLHRMGDAEGTTGHCAAVLKRVRTDERFCEEEPDACARLLAVDVRGAAWRAAGQSGTPYIAHRDDWVRLAPRWQRYTEVIRAVARREAGWIADMCSYSLAVLDLGLDQQVWHDLAVQSAGTDEPAWLPNSRNGWDASVHNPETGAPGRFTKLPPFTYHYAPTLWLEHSKAEVDEANPSGVQFDGFLWDKKHPSLLREDVLAVGKRLPEPVAQHKPSSEQFSEEDSRSTRFLMRTLVPTLNDALRWYGEHTYGAEASGAAEAAGTALQWNGTADFVPRATFEIRPLRTASLTYPKGSAELVDQPVLTALDPFGGFAPLRDAYVPVLKWHPLTAQHGMDANEHKHNGGIVEYEAQGHKTTLATAISKCDAQAPACVAVAFTSHSGTMWPVALDDDDNPERLVLVLAKGSKEGDAGDAKLLSRALFRTGCTTCSLYVRQGVLPCLSAANGCCVTNTGCAEGQFCALGGECQPCAGCESDPAGVRSVLGRPCTEACAEKQGEQASAEGVGGCTSHEACDKGNFCMHARKCAPCSDCEAPSDAVDGSCSVCKDSATRGGAGNEEEEEEEERDDEDEGEGHGEL